MHNSGLNLENMSLHLLPLHRFEIKTKPKKGESQHVRQTSQFRSLEYIRLVHVRTVTQ